MSWLDPFLAGKNAYTTLAQAFNVPNSGVDVTITVAGSAWMVPGQYLYIGDAGFYTVTSLPDSTHAVVRNTGDGNNASPGTLIQSGPSIGPSGPPGSAGTVVLGGDLSGVATNAHVNRILGTTVGTAGGGLTTGQVMRATGASTADWGTVDLANAAAITGILGTAHQAAQTLGGDLSGTTASATVAKINGATVSTAGGSLTTGKVLRVTGASTVDYGAVDLANASAVTGTLPAGNQASQTVGGDLSGTTASATVAKINGATVSTAAGSLTTGNVLRVTGSSTCDWGAVNLASSSAVTGTLPTGNQASQSMGGDVSGTTASATVAKVNGATVGTAAGSLTTGNVLRVTGSSACDWGAVNLASSSAVTGTLPTGNQASQSMGGDVSGTTASATVAKINATTVSTAGGSLTTGTVLRVTGSSTADWGALDLANTSAVTGVLPKGNQANQDCAGDVTGTTGATVVSAISGTTPISITPVTLQWAKGTASPTLKQASADSSVAGTSLTIVAQGTTSANAGALILAGGNATTSGAGGNVSVRVGTGDTNALINLQQGSTTAMSITPIPSGATLFAAASTVTSLQFSINSSSSASTGASNTFQAQSCTNASGTIVGGQVNITAGSATGASTQNSGGDIVLTAGTGANASTNYFGFVKVAGHLNVGRVSQAVTDGATTVMTAGNSSKNIIRCTGSLTADRTVQLGVSPTSNQGILKIVRNATTGGHNLTIQYDSGSGVTVATGAAAVITSDGTNAEIVLTGT